MSSPDTHPAFPGRGLYSEYEEQIVIGPFIDRQGEVHYFLLWLANPLPTEEKERQRKAVAETVRRLFEQGRPCPTG